MDEDLKSFIFIVNTDYNNIRSLPVPTTVSVISRSWPEMTEEWELESSCLRKFLNKLPMGLAFMLLNIHGGEMAY